MSNFQRLEDPTNYPLTAKVKLRPGARAGVWCSCILPAALILSCTQYSDSVSIGYKVAVLCSVVSAVYLNLGLFDSRTVIGHILSLTGTCLVCICNGFPFMSSVLTSSIITTINMKSYSFLLTLLERFPYSFSIGEATLIIEGSISFVVSTVINSLFNDANQSSIFSQLLLLGMGIFLLASNQSSKLQQLVPFTALLLTVMGLLTFPLMAYALQKNPIAWFLTDIMMSTATRTLLIVYWAVCSFVALLIAWHFGTGAGPSTMKLTILRKYFHGVVVAVYLPGILMDVELLFTASVIALAAFLLLEAVRLYNLEGLGPILNSSMAGFLDEKDQGSLILTHTYLLVGCSLPVWIFPGTTVTNAVEVLLLSSGVIALGIGDAAASIGGSLYGRTKWSGSEKSVEGTAFSVAAELLFVFILQILGVFGSSSSSFPWLRFFVASVATSLVEAHTTQVDNLVLPLVMYCFIIL